MRWNNSWEEYMLRWIFFSSRLPDSWEWWAFREAMIIAGAFMCTSLLIVLLFISPDAPFQMKVHPVGIMASMLWMYFWLVRKYSFWNSMIFAWGIGLPTSHLVASPNMVWSTIFLIIGVACSMRAFSSGPAFRIRQRA